MSGSSSIEVILALSSLGRLLILGAGLFFATTLKAQPAAEMGVEPWSEALVSVAAFEPATSLFRHAGNWRLVGSGAIDRTELDYFDLPPVAAGKFELWCPPAIDTGCIRFVRFDGVEQRPVRPAARAWDTGGIYSIMVRSDDVPALYSAALDLGWWAESPPIRFQFGTSDLRNVVLQGPHGINLAVYERITPDFTGFPLGPISQGFNSMRMVRDKAAMREFFTDKLGFGVLFDADSEPDEPAFSNFGIPYNLTPQIARSATALYPVAGETGRVEVMQIAGFAGRDHSSAARPPNLGILSVRYPVRDLAEYRAWLSSRGIVPAFSAEQVAIAGIGVTDLFAVRDPDGSLTEFYAAP